MAKYYYLARYIIYTIIIYYIYISNLSNVSPRHIDATAAFFQSFSGSSIGGPTKFQLPQNHEVRSLNSTREVIQLISIGTSTRFFLSKKDTSSYYTGGANSLWQGRIFITSPLNSTGMASRASPFPPQVCCTASFDRIFVYCWMIGKTKMLFACF